MSMEQAILAHAAALEKLAEAIAHAYGAGPLLAAHAGAQPIGTVTESTGDTITVKGTKTKPTAAPTEAPTEAPDPAESPELTKAQQRAAMEKAVKDTERQAAMEKAVKGAAGDEDEAPLDYVKDVRPVLLAIIKKVGKTKVQALISTFGVEKADLLDPAQYRELLAQANKLEA